MASYMYMYLPKANSLHVKKYGILVCIFHVGEGDGTHMYNPNNLGVHVLSPPPPPPPHKGHHTEEGGGGGGGGVHTAQ